MTYMQILSRRFRTAVLVMLVLILITAGFPISTQAEELPIAVLLDGVPIAFDQPPVIVNGRTLVPVRAVAEQMGGTVTWKESDSTVHILLGGHDFLFTVDDTTAYLDGASHRLDTVPQIIGDRTLMPIRFLAESIGYTVHWYEASKTVEIRTGSRDLYSLSVQGKVQRFQNNFDGYRLSLPADLQLDLSMLKVRTLFASDQMSLEIYRQDTGKSFSVQDYVQYSNRAIRQNTSRFHIVADRMLPGCAYPCTYLEWYRDPLARIPDDKYHYYKADIAKGKVVYTLFFKSQVPIQDTVLSVIRSFAVAPVTVSADEIPDRILHGGAHPKNEETAQYLTQTFGWEAPLTWGIYEPSYRTTGASLQEIESTVNSHFPVLLTYTGIRSTYDPESVGIFLDRAWAEGRVVELTIQNTPSGGADMCYDVLNGKYDDFLTDYAAAVADFGHPVLLRLFNEMNGDWCFYSAYQMGLDTDLSRALYQYVAGFFERAGADNVLYIFNPNGVSFPDFKWNHQLLYYPGDRYADIWGITAYNTGTYYSDEKWQSFDTLYQDLCNETLTYTNMPLMITEFACARQGGNKEAWVENMFSAIKRYPAIKVAVWWNEADHDGANIARAYYILDSEELKSIWRNYFENR